MSKKYTEEDVRKWVKIYNKTKNLRKVEKIVRVNRKRIALMFKKYKTKFNIKSSREEKRELLKKGIKLCPGCRKKKKIEEFCLSKKCVAGRAVYCRKCAASDYRKNKPKILKRVKLYRIKNKEKLKNYRREKYIKNRKIILEKQKEYLNCPKTRLKRKKYHKQWTIKNKDKIRKYKVEYEKRRIKNDPIFKLIKQLRASIRRIFKDEPKKGKALKLLGCTVQELKKHIEIQFKNGMNWKNHGKVWHLDHIVPLCSIKNKKDKKQIKKVCHYTNLRPLRVKENLKKSAEDKRKYIK